MSDQLYLSLWYPNFNLAALPPALIEVLRQFALISGDKRVSAASAYPLGFTESPTYQRIYVDLDNNNARAQDASGSIIENAVAEATEQLHDDMAYEFEMKWKLWVPILGDTPDGPQSSLDTLWKQQPSTVRILGLGPEFDDASFDQNGHIRVDFGLDTPWVLDEEELDLALGDAAALHIQKNVEMLLAFTLSVEKHCGISSRLLWTESGKPLAQKLIDRLQRLH